MFLQGKGQTKMIHAPDSGSEFSRRSSLNSEEKFLFDELQNELMTLKRAMRSKEEDASKKVSENLTSDNNGVARTLKKLRTSNGDYYIKQ